LKTKFIFLLVTCLFNLNAQTLTISSSGEDGSSTRTNWSISGTTLTVTGTANIRASVIANALASGNLSILGNTATFNVTLSEIITATGNNLLTVASATNTGTITVNAAISLAGAAIFNSNAFVLGDGINISTSTPSAITINTNLNFSTSGSTRRTISSAGGDIIIHADKDANGSGVLDLDYLTINPGVGNIIIRGETAAFNIGSTDGPYINGTGSFTFESSDASFGQLIYTSWFQLDQDNNGISGLTLGKIGSSANIEQNTNFTIAGHVNYYGGFVNVIGTLTSTSGNILLKGISNNNPCVNISSSGGITKSVGIGTLTLQGHARVINSGTISATGTGRLNVVMWSDFDNSNNDGGASHGGTITTNGGHVWMGGSNSNGGSYAWNGLTVGDGPSIGSTNYNHNPLDLFGSITTSNGHVFIWAGDGIGGSALVASSNASINSGSGNITLMADEVYTTSTFPITTTGTISLVPNVGSYATALTLGGTLTSGNFSFNTSHYNGLRINNMSAVGGLTIGRTEELFSNGNPIVFGNSSNVTIASALSIAGPISVYGDNIFAQQNLTATANGAAILLQATGYIDISASDIIQTSNGNITLRANASGTAVVLPNSTIGVITLNSGSSLLSNGGNITLGGNFTGTQGAGLYAASSRVGGAPGILISNATLNAAGGNINIYGRCSTSYDDGIRLQATITTTGAGSIGLYGDAFGGYNGTQYFGGITFFNEASRIEAVNGNVTLEGILTNSQSSEGYAINFYRSSGLTGQIKHIQILSQTGDIQITADRGSSIGGGIGHSSWGHIYFGSPLNNSYNASGDIKFTYSNLIQAANNGFKVKTTGAVTYEPVANSFIAAQTLPINSNYVLAESASRLTIGKTNNLANITIASAQTIAGPIEISGGTLAINANLTSTATTDTGITLNGQNIIQNSGIAVTTSGANINYLASGFSSTSGVDNAIKIGDISGARASINAGGGNISLTGSFGTTSTAGSTDFGIWLFSTDVITSGTGSITLTGNATNTLSTVTAYGISMGNATLKTASGAITLNGTGGKASTNSRGIVADQYSNKIISASGAITFNEIKPTGLSGSYTGFFMRPTTTVNTFIGADGSEVSSSSSSVTIKGDRASFETNGTFRNNINTSGAIVIESDADLFEAAPALTGLTISGNPSSVRIGKTTNTANITLGSAVTAAGPISVYGGNIDINNNLTSTANNAKILIKASGQINTNNTRTFQTNNGDFILWSDADNSNGGRIWLGLNNTINTANGSISNGLSGGGKIVLAGGLDNGANGGTANDDIPDGFASNNSSIGVYLGNTSSNYTQMYSGGGDILIKGASTFASASNDGTGLWSDGRWLANSGKGTISIQGTSTHFFGINFSAPLNNISSGNKHIEFVSDKSTGNAVEVTGSSNASYGVVFNYENPKEVLATGGGAITITGIGGGGLQGIFFQNTDILSTSGEITMNGGSNGIRVASSGVRIGSRLSTAITSSTSNVKWTTNSIDLINLSSGFSNNFSTSGNVTIEPFSNSFTNAISYPITNLSVANTVSGLTLGKSTNTTNITFGSTTTIAGPITAFGGTIAINENIASSNGSTISLFGNALTFGTNKIVTSNNGQLIIAPQNASNTIGLGGATGTLSLPASYFSTNFSDGFANIQIGSNSQTGNIAANTFTLRDNMTFLTSGSLSLGGKPVLGNNNITLGSSISSITASASNYFQTNGNGKVMSILANNASRLFPVGNAFYNGVTITNKTNASDTFSVLIKDSVLGNGAQGNAITTPHIKATWDISKTNANAGSGVDFVFSWDTAQERGGISNFILNHHNGTVWQIATGTTGAISGSGTRTKTITHTGYAGGFSPFAFGNTATPLPIELIAFNEKCTNDFIKIQWTTASEKNNKMFELYRSDNAIDWSLIHTTDGQGDKASETNYQYIDNKKQASYYRLKDIDYDGIENWSQIIFADCESNTSKTEVYPNPASDYIKVTTAIDEKTILRIVSIDGRILKTLPLVSEQTLVDIKTLVSGVYIIEIKNQKSTTTFKINKI
jgi:hypothetical protein